MSTFKKLLVVLVAGFVFGASSVPIVSADEPVGTGVTEGAACRRSDCPVGGEWGNCRWVQLEEGPVVWQCECLCVPPDAERSGNLGYVFATHNRWGLSYGTSVLGLAQVGFWGPSPEEYREYRGWATFPLAGLPEQKVAVATVVLDVDTQWLATNENNSLVVELIDIGSWCPRVYYELDYPLTVAELLRLTTEEVKEMLEYYNEPLRFAIPLGLLEERISRAQQNPKWTLGLRLRFEGAPANSLLDVRNAKLHIKWVR